MQRFWNGSDWTGQTREADPCNTAPQPLRPEPPQHQSNLRLWGAAGLAAAVILAGGWWLVVRHDQPSATASATSDASSLPSQLSLPSQELPSSDVPAPERRPESAPPADSSFHNLSVGDRIHAIPDCPNTAQDATGKVGEDGRVRSGETGLSFPMIEGFTPEPINFGFIHQANSIKKDYSELGWAATVTVGALRPSEGFSEVTPSAARVVGCLLANNTLYPEGSTAEVTSISYREDRQDGWLNVRIPVSGIAKVTADYVSVATLLKDDIMHVALVITPDHDKTGYETVWNTLGRG